MKIGAIKYEPAASYIAAYPCQQKANTTQFNYGGASGYATLVSGDPFWYFLGCPVKFRTPSGSTGIIADTIYYLRRQGAGSYTLHNALAGALTNSDLASLTSNGGGTNYIFPAFVVDIAKSNHAIYNTKLTDQNAFAVSGYIGSNSESGTQPQNFYIPSSVLSGSYTPGVGSLLISTKVKGAAPSVNKRAIFGNGGVGSSQPGFSVYSDAVDPTKLRIGFSDSQTTIASSISGVAVFDSTEHTVALAVDGPNAKATLYIDGVEDVSLTLTVAPQISNVFCFGGYGTNALPVGLRFIHMFAFPGALPGSIAKVVKHLAINSSRVMLNEHFV